MAEILLFADGEPLGDYTDHDVILQTLDREHISEGKKVFLPKEMFKNNLGDWDGVPVIFGKRHPDTELFNNNPVQALDDIDGRVVGYAFHASYKPKGRPRIESKLAINDKEVDQLYEGGKLALSPAFYADAPNKVVISEPRPHHVLVFEEIPGIQTPGDKGTLFLSQEEHDVFTKELDNASVDELLEIWAFIGTLSDGLVEDEDQTEELDCLNCMVKST